MVCGVSIVFDYSSDKHYRLKGSKIMKEKSLKYRIFKGKERFYQEDNNKDYA
jgi:hypothetical protein